MPYFYEPMNKFPYILYVKESTKNGHHEVHSWLRENIGAHNEKWHSVIFNRHEGCRYGFKHKEDAMACMLRWV